MGRNSSLQPKSQNKTILKSARWLCPTLKRTMDLRALESKEEAPLASGLSPK
ncbi:hypothetical protein [Leptospira stimsonii]|uniref:hypothetical protein n=1 Tax=Leptospira stimsonii TaxID=2202203 RepID=UPI0014384E29|nr:hypothetical protein [Leptospira stimsonii]